MATFFIIKRLVLSRVLATLVMLLMPAEIWRMRKFRERWENTAGWSDDFGRAEDLREWPTRFRQSSDLQRSMGWMRSTPLILWPTPREFTAGARWRYHRLSTKQTRSASTIWQQKNNKCINIGLKFPDFPVCSKFPDSSMTGKYHPILPGFPVRVRTLVIDWKFQENLCCVIHLESVQPLLYLWEVVSLCMV